LHAFAASGFEMIRRFKKMLLTTAISLSLFKGMSVPLLAFDHTSCRKRRPQLEHPRASEDPQVWSDEVPKLIVNEEWQANDMEVY